MDKQVQQQNVISSEDWTWDLWFQVWQFCVLVKNLNGMNELCAWHKLMINAYYLKIAGICKICGIWHLHYLLITARKRSCGKVMFLHLSEHGGVSQHASQVTWANTPPPDRHPSSADTPMVNERAVRILLECIRVEILQTVI